jgi:poly(A) polymerase Pap1
MSSVLNRPWAPRAKELGTTPPLSTAAPDEIDARNNQTLEEVLGSMGVFEGPQQQRQREEVLLALEEIVREWLFQESMAQVSNTIIITHQYHNY